MATREENLKKINDRLEQLSDEQLEQVAGGGYHSVQNNLSEILDDDPNLNAAGPAKPPIPRPRPR